jgi:hypothetical protein
LQLQSDGARLRRALSGSQRIVNHADRALAPNGLSGPPIFSDFIR